ncbi:hypothetical protein J004_06259 [Cryptococcus neoformans]|nr:hypothetical protein J004_06259 [Cryptococcus neoformans var. grubii]
MTLPSFPSSWKSPFYTVLGYRLLFSLAAHTELQHRLNPEAYSAIVNKPSQHQMLKHSNANAQTPTMPPKGQTQKDAPLSEDPNPVGVEDDFKASSLMQMLSSYSV